MPSSQLDSPRLALGGLSEVPEESTLRSPHSPYFHQPMSGSASSFNLRKASSNSSLASAATSSRQPTGPRTPSGLRSSSTHHDVSDAASSFRESGIVTPKEKTRPGSPAATIKEKDKDKDRDRERDKEGKDGHATSRSTRVPANSAPAHPWKLRNTPHLPGARDAEPAPATLMYWSRAPAYGTMLGHGMRAHTVTLVDSVAWIFGGCDEKGCWKDIWHFNIETMQWSHPEMQGDLPPPCRAHSATLVDRRIIVFGGGEGPEYYNSVYVLDTVTRRWQLASFPEDTKPPPRRAHTAVAYRNKVWIFGGGNGASALNDLWTLDVAGPVEKMKWEELPTRGRPPKKRGYHTANLIGNVMIVTGGSDGKECFSDIWCLNLDTLSWSQVKLDVMYRRLAHSATQVGSYLFIWGGHDGSNYTHDLVLFNLVSLNFETRTICGKPPTARGYHAALVADSRLFIFGGFNGLEVYDDVNVLDLAGTAYLPQVTSFTIDVD